MKKIIVTLMTVVMAFSFSAVLFASTSASQGNAKLIKQIVLSDETPAPEPTPAPAPEPAPTPEPEPK